MSYPKWRHHPEHESVIVYSADQESSQCGEGWRDDRNFTAVDAFEYQQAAGREVPKNKGGRPRKV